MTGEPRRVRFPLEGLNASGGVRVVTQIAGALARRGHRVTLAAPDYASTPHYPLDPAVRLQIVPTGGRARRLRYAGWLCLFSAADCDVCFATGYKTPYCLLASKLLGHFRARLVYLIQHYEPASHVECLIPPGPRRAVLRAVARWGYRLPLTRVAVSGWIRDRIGRPDTRVVPNGIDPAVFHPAGAPREAAGRLVIGAIGRAAPWKGYADFVRAIETLPEGIRTGCRVLVASQEETALPGGIEGERVRPEDDAAVAEFYRRCDLFVFPSHLEGFGLPPLEAMACGTPVVTTDCGGVREFAADSNALIVPPGRPDALGAAVSRLVSDPALRDRLRTAGLETARRFTLDRMLSAYIELVEEDRPS